MPPALELTITKKIPAARKAVFEAWLDKATLSKFMGGGDGNVCARAEVDARVGGTFFIVMRNGEKDIPHTGVYTTVDRYGRLAFSWLSPYAGPGSVVTITFKELGPKETELTLHHTGFTTEGQRNGHQSGWTHIVDLCARVLS